MNRDINDRELVITRALPATPSVVFDAWTTPEHLTHWWGPDGFATTTHEMDLRPGGRWLFTMHGPDGRDYANHVEFLEVERPHRLAYRHRDDGESEPVSFAVCVTFAPLGTTKTLLTMRATFDSPDDLARIEDAYGASRGQVETVSRFAAYLGEAAAATPRSDRELATSHVVRAPQAEVFAAFEDPGALARWWGPDGFTNTFHEFDFRPSGPWKLTMHGPDGKDYPNESVFAEIERPRRVVLEHHSTPRFVIEFAFTPILAGTLVELHQTFESVDACRRIAEFVGPANQQLLARLAAVVEDPGS